MTTHTNPVRLRMAPSPTGLMHIGTLRTVLYDALFADQNEGVLILRIEDTDQSREVEGAVENLLAMLKLSGISYQEGPFLTDGHKLQEKGDYGPYTQSKRLSLYQEHCATLLKKGHAYYCFCSSDRLDEMRTQQQKDGRPPMYDRTCASLTEDEVAARKESGDSHVVRMRIPRGKEVVVRDLVRGDVTFKTDIIDDQVIMKSDGFPTYHLAVVVDDHLMKISHVFRGEEWLPSTPKHIILYKMFEWEAPLFAHLPLLLNEKKAKLSKRHGDVAVEDFLAKGYLPEAILNFVALLGWNPGKGSTDEIFTYADLVKIFSIENIHKAGAIVDVKRLNWINAQYIKKLSVKDLAERALPFLQEKDFYRESSRADKDVLATRLITVEQDRLERLVDIGDENMFFFESITVEKTLLFWKENTEQQTRIALEQALSVLDQLDESQWNQEGLVTILMEAAGEDRGSFLWPLRAALTGQKRSPSPMDCVWVLGKEESTKRIQSAITLLT